MKETKTMNNETKTNIAEVSALIVEILSNPATEPMNPVTGRAYTRTNKTTLENMTSHGYASNVWATYKQWKELGLVVRKGEKGTPIVRMPIVTNKETGEGELVKGKPRTYHVFAAEQVEPMTEND